MTVCLNLILLLTFFLTAPPIASAVDQIFVKEYTYYASELDSKVSCRANALVQVKRMLLEELGTYLESHTKVKDHQVTQDEITTLAAGII
jgi:hypothetical protein